MLRIEQRGVTSIISTLRIDPRLYETLLHFFRSTSYAIADVYRRWAEIVQRSVPLYDENGRLILLGDHTKVSKEGRRMPCVGTHHQESENSGKPEYIQGHNFGFIAALATVGATFRSIPLLGEIQEGKAKQYPNTVKLTQKKIAEKRFFITPINSGEPRNIGLLWIHIKIPQWCEPCGMPNRGSGRSTKTPYGARHPAEKRGRLTSSAGLLRCAKWGCLRKVLVGGRRLRMTK
jgi:hypothetical protein